MQTPRMTDRHSLTRNRTRAARAPALFLHEDIALEVQERLTEVNRSFTSPAVITGFPDFWRGVLPEARIVPDDDVLDLTPGGHDLVIHAMALHWADDPVGQIIQCRHALRPDGMFLAACFGGHTLHELRASLAGAEVAQTGGLSPRVLPMAEIRDLGGLLQRSGLALPVADSHLRRVEYAHAFRLMADLRAMGEANALATRLKHPTRRAVFADMAARYARDFPAADGRIMATFEVIFLTGWAPDSSQQQPLRPGSAAQRLGDALGSPEIPLPATPRDG